MLRIAGVLPLVASLSGAAAAANPALPDDLSRQAHTILAQHCLECHGPDQQQGGLRLDVAESALRKSRGDDRAIIAAGEPESSELMWRVTAEDSKQRMPHGKEPLAEQEIRQLRAWIASGASWPTHWAYVPLQEVGVPQLADDRWSASVIDRLVLTRLRQHNLEPSPPADRYTLIKRLYYDLIGLPPEPDAVAALVGDTSVDAYERLVDRLLASPHFGERWGRYWLDKARYADSDGYEKDNNRPNAWRYRDWVIAAINDDLPYDAFVIRQLAGDLLEDADPLNRLATAFHRQTLTNTEGGTDAEEWRVAAVMDRTETIATVWMGLTVGCARCHNHKYDQIAQREYYQLFAFFNNGDETTTEVPRGLHGQSEETDNMKVRIVAERRADRRTTRLLRRGDFLQPQEVVQAQTLAVLPPLRPRAASRPDRLDLARWLVDGRNPLPPRVIANHVWAHLFGNGLVNTMNDFGVRGDPPTHPRLLDHLANQLIRFNWSRKRLIKAIVMSRTYRQSSRHRPELADIDATNRLLHRQNRLRVDAEIIRDIHLAAGGLLSRKLGGPSVYPPIPSSITELTYNSSFKWPTSEGGDRYRRGMYTFFKRTAPHPNLTTFDCPDSIKTVVRRDRSNTPIGALVMLNNEVFIEAARGLARRVLVAKLSDADRLRRAFGVCVARPPAEDELAHLLTLLRKSRSWYAEHPHQAEALAAEEGAEESPVETAAWIATVRTVLNLDEFITRE